jgi:hypothetical protein
LLLLGARSARGALALSRRRLWSFCVSGDALQKSILLTLEKSISLAIDKVALAAPFLWLLDGYCLRSGNFFLLQATAPFSYTYSRSVGLPTDK